MRLSTLITRGLAAASVGLATPLTPPSDADIAAGSVVTDKNVTYEMIHFNEIKTFDGKVDDYKYPYPVTYEVKPGFALKPPVAWVSPIGTFIGPTNGDFKDWIECYKCWSTTTQDIAGRASAVVPASEKAIPCGYVRLPEGGTASLNENGKKFKNPQDFAINGAYYYPSGFYVRAGCSCRFYTVHNSRGGPEMISEEHGLAQGGFEAHKAARYACWLGA